MERTTLDPNIQSVVGSLESLGRVTDSLCARYDSGEISGAELAKRCSRIQERRVALVDQLHKSLQDCGNGLSMHVLLGDQMHLPPDVRSTSAERFRLPER